MRPPVDTILAPPVPRHLRRIAPAGAAADAEPAAVRAQVVCFWDVCQPASLRLLEHLAAWHERYAGAGLRITAVHAPSCEACRDDEVVAAAVAVLAPPFEVVLDSGFELWRLYENPGWPSRYVLAPGLRVADVHHGEGGDGTAEAVVRELLADDGPAVEPLGPLDAEDALLVVPTADAEGAFAGDYAAGEVWVVVDAPGAVLVDGAEVELPRTGAHRVRRHPAHAEGRIAITPVGSTRVLRTVFGPGAAPTA